MLFQNQPAFLAGAYGQIPPIHPGNSRGPLMALEPPQKRQRVESGHIHHKFLEEMSKIPESTDSAQEVKSSTEPTDASITELLDDFPLKLPMSIVPRISWKPAPPPKREPIFHQPVFSMQNLNPPYQCSQPSMTSTT